MDNDIYESDRQAEPVAPPKFLVETTLNADVQAEAVQVVQSKGVQIFGYVCMGLCAAMFIALIVLFFTTENSENLFYAAVMLLVLAYMLYTKFVAPKKQRARWEESIARSFGTTELHLTTEFYDYSMMQILREDEENMIDAGYSELVELKQTENLFLIRCKNRQWFFLSKNGFRVGNVSDFERFITERMGGK